MRFVFASALLLAATLGASPEKIAALEQRPAASASGERPASLPGSPEVAGLIELARQNESRDLAKAWDYAEQARAKATTPVDQLHAELRRGAIQRRRGEYDAAFATAQAGFYRSSALRDERLAAEFLHLLGHTEWSRTNFPAAVQHYRKSAELAERAGHLALATRAHSGMGTTYRDLEDYPSARRHFERALALAEQVGAAQLHADVLNNFANYHADVGEHAQSAALHRRALALREAAGNQAGMADSFFNLGTAAANTGDNVTALDYYLRALPIYEQLGYNRNLANLSHNIAGVLRKLGRTDEALAHLARALELATSLNTQLLYAYVYQELAATHAARGDFATAFSFQQKFIAADQAVRGEKIRRQVAALNARYDADRRQHELALLRREHELQEAELRRARTQRYGLLIAFGLGAIALGALVSRQRLKLATERRVVRETREAKEAAELADSFKTRLVGIASHDLKAPVAALIGGAESMKRDAHDPAAVAAMAEMMEQEGRRMLKLIRDLLDVTALETGRLELEQTTLPIAAVVRESLEALEPRARAKNQSLTCGIEPQAEAVCVSGDPGRLRQVIDNLLDNAIKFTPAGKAVHVAVTAADGAARVAVQDAGPGLAPEDYVRVFAPFQKLSARPTGGEHSTGLGLSIVRELVALHGGQMIVDSVPGEGATFGFELPVAG